MEPQFIRFDDVRSVELATGVTGRPLFGQRPEGALVLDVFNPVREDYLERWNALLP